MSPDPRTRDCLWDGAAHSLGAGRSARWRSGSLTTTVSLMGACSGRRVSPGGGQGPAPPGKLSGGRDVRDDGAFAAFGVGHPPMMEPVVAGLGASDGRRRRHLPLAPQDRGGPAGLAVVPGGLDQRPAHVPVTGLGDPPWAEHRPDRCEPFVWTKTAEEILARRDPVKRPRTCEISRGCARSGPGTGVGAPRRARGIVLRGRSGRPGPEPVGGSSVRCCRRRRRRRP